MMDYQAKLERFETLATDCDRLGKLVTDGSNREMYSRLAVQYRELADDMRKLIATKMLLKTRATVAPR
jgi:hypothetical protein